MVLKPLNEKKTKHDKHNKFSKTASPFPQKSKVNCYGDYKFMVWFKLINLLMAAFVFITLTKSIN